MEVKELNSIKKQLDLLSKELGVYALGSSWSYYNNLNFQCDLTKLTEYAKLHDIPIEVIDNQVGIHIGKHWFYGV